MVDDAGCDPTGQEACDEELVDAVGRDVLLQFPEGVYRFEKRHAFENVGLLGFVGEGDVRFSFPRGARDYWMVLKTREILFEGIDIDIRSPNTSIGLKFRSDQGFRVANVRQIGRGTHRSRGVPNFVVADVKDPNSMGVFRNLVATAGSAIGRYKSGSGRGGVYVGPSNRGTIRFVDCHLEEFGNNGLYCSRTPGNVQVVGGIYRNNNAANVRISGEGSYVENASVEVDMSSYSGPRDSLQDSFNPRGIVIEQGPLINRPKPAGAEVRNCEVAIRDAPARTQGAVHLRHTGRAVILKNTRIRVDAPGVQGVLSVPLQTDDGGRSASRPRWVVMDGVVLTGTSRTGRAVYLVDAAYSTIRNTYLEQPGANRDGVVLKRSAGTVFEGGEIRTSGYPIQVDFGGRSPQEDCLLMVNDVAPVVSSDRTLPSGAVRRYTLSSVPENPPSERELPPTFQWPAGSRCLASDAVDVTDFDAASLSVVGMDSDSVRGAVLQG